MFKATKRTLTALALVAAAISPSAAHATLDQHPTTASTRPTTHPRASPAVNPCSGSCTGPAYGSPRGTSWQQAEKVAPLRQTISPTAPGPASGVARYPHPARGLPRVSERPGPPCKCRICPAHRASFPKRPPVGQRGDPCRRNAPTTQRRMHGRDLHRRRHHRATAS